MQLDYTILEDVEYERALAALRAAVDPTKGDFLAAGFVHVDPEEVVPSTIIDWPQPLPGSGMDESTGAAPWTPPDHEPPLTPNRELQPTDIPSPNAGWSEIGWFALRFDGYAELGQQEVATLANRASDYYREHGTIDDRLDLAQLRGCLFFEQRRYRHFGHAPRPSRSPVHSRAH
jgi:hypothetical protein